MSNENTKRRPPHGPGRVVEKPKNFKLAITKLFKNLNSFRAFIIIS